MLTPEDMSRLSRLLDEALALAPERREAWLAALPPEAAHLAAPLRDMLSRAPDPLTLPRLGSWEGEDAAAVHAGDRIGPYRLIEEIGRGGMGSVWRAERADGSYQREVALKLPRLTWGDGLARLMAQERDIGAMLEHPNIARLYDAGIDARGWPYLALELVAGRPIDAWCREQGLGVADKLALLLQIMRAVSYAHGRLVVHRDIKPSNVLVTPSGEVRLLDFGIARLLGNAAADVTEDGMRRLTPHYASPEQLRGEPVTVATDVYSLGVLAFELLTGQTPYRLARPSRAAWEEAVLQGEPERASSRCEDSSTARALRGDIDAILAKALKRDPAARYASVDAFAQDLERHLRGEAVLAQPDSSWYRLGRTLRRHRLAFATTAIVAMALAVGGGLALRQAQRAELAAQRQRVVTGFAAALLRASQTAFHARADARYPTPELALADSAALIEQRFTGEPELQAELLGAVARLFLDMGRPQLAAQQAGRQFEALQRAGASPAERARPRLLAAQAWLSASQWPEAEAAAHEVLILAGSDTVLRAEALACLAQAIWWGGRPDAAAAPLKTLEELLPRLPASTTAAARWHALRAEMAERDGHFEQADGHFARAVELAAGPDPMLAQRLRQLAAYSLVERGQLEAARPFVQATAQGLREQGGEAAIEARVVEAEFAVAAWRHGQLNFAQATEAVDSAEAFIDAQRARPMDLSTRIGYARGDLALTHGDVQAGIRAAKGSGDWQSPLPREVQGLRRARFWSDLSLATGDPFARDVGAWLARGRTQLGMVGHPDTAADTARAALAQAWHGDPAAGLAWLDHTPAIEGMGAQAIAARAQLAWVRAQILLDLDRPAAAASAVQGQPPVPVRAVREELFSTAAVAAQLACTQGQAARGRDELVAQAEALLQDRNPAAPRPAWLRAHAGLCALAAGDRTGALALAAQARQAFKAQPDVAPYFKRPLLELEAALRH